MSTTIRPGSKAASERCPCCNGRGFEYVESRGDLPPYEVRCTACGGTGAVEALPEPTDLGPDPDIDGMVARFWDEPLPAA